MKSWIQKYVLVAVVFLFAGSYALAQQVSVIRDATTSNKLVVNADGSINIAGGSTTSAPTKTTTSLTANATACTVPGGASCTTILASTDILSYARVALTINNTGANAIDNVIVQLSPDGTTWENWDATTFASLSATAGSTMKSIQLGDNSRHYIRVQARAAANTSADVWLTLSN